FSYELPTEKIAQRPRDKGQSRLLQIECDSAACCLKDRAFSELATLLKPGDLIVLNNTKVLPARFFARSQPQDESKELEETETWEALVRPLKKLKEGMRISLSLSLSAKMLGRTEDGTRARLQIEKSNKEASFTELFQREGTMPIPPYIRSGQADEADKLRYQTVYADSVGSVAAPTAGLHFTEELFSELASAGIEHCFLTHHVGPGSFLPIRDDVDKHEMSSEFFQISEDVWRRIQSQRQRGGRIVAVGTTSVRALESAASIPDFAPETLVSTDLFIRPGYQFSLVDVLITNFHQPQSTHLQLVAAFAGTGVVEQAYTHALRREYFFLSYGDSMIFLPQKSPVVKMEKP
ncbi:UNVERIFIED_CONTAM: hypothetical protein GTU68_056436, partial [Idotea baltica]|nr:hypothetical protein [Idotea baltica]